ncbi:MAG TPA: helix-turn-helix transcriptional regulator [Pseudolabrys sp.]|nr:helix-turn-helix transcriptional regulator [Pseudolabrys sp.]
MKLEIKREWCLAAARREGDAEVGAGRVAFDPTPEIEGAVVQALPVEAMHLAFGKLVNLLRRKRNWSIEELAKHAQVDTAELLLIEKEGRHQTEPHTVYQLANVFQLNFKGLQQLAGLTVVRNSQVVTEAVRFAASSDSIEKLSKKESEDVEQFVAALNRLVDGEKDRT